MSTSLLTIANDLNGLSRSSWIVVAYLVAYSSTCSSISYSRQKLTINSVANSMV